MVFVVPKANAEQIDSTENERFSIHGQMTLINQFKPPFTANYSGTNSLSTQQDNERSFTTTFFLGARLWKGASVFINPEIAAGSGLSQAMGVGAATNGETFRIGSPAPQLYLARLFYKQVFNLTDKLKPRETQFFHHHSDFNQLASTEPIQYFSFTIGKIGIADYFDDNTFSHDPRTQFMSWALMDNGAWDYPANTRGYTPSVVLEYVTPRHEIRYGISLMPQKANGNDMNWDLSKSASHTLEYTRKFEINHQKGAIRLLGFYTTTQMGNYRQSIALKPVQPVIEETRKYGNTKYGFGLNAEQNLTKDLGCFFRASWNDGINETWAFTEIDHSISGGLVLTGQAWKRENDNIGLAYVASGLSDAHRAYLKAGGKGFMLGDGYLNYAWEHLMELYYSAALLKNHLFVTGTYQMLVNPGYNLDRGGPVNIFSIRLHARI